MPVEAKRYRKFDPDFVRKDFPCLDQSINGNRLVFLDSAASAQKPQKVLDALNLAYAKEYANIHRGIYHLSNIATNKFELSRKKVAQFLNAKSENEIVFCKSATEAINLVAYSYGTKFIKENDEIIISGMEHHANIVPWQQLCQRTGSILRIAPIKDNGDLDLDSYSKMLNKKTALVAMTHMSNVLGLITPIKDITTKAHAVGAKVLVDASQSVVHSKIDVANLNCDFLVFSGHKLYGPNGVGILYGKYDLLESMPPYQTGGEMIEQVDFAKTTFQLPPLRFEAGTPIISEVIAFSAAIDYVEEFNRQDIAKYEFNLTQDTISEIKKLGQFTILGETKNKSGVIAFYHNTAHANDIAMVLDKFGIAVRSGHLCAQPLLKHFGLTAVTRISFGMYNSHKEIELVLKALKKVNSLFGEK